MSKTKAQETDHRTIRSRLTGIVVVPSVVLLVMWLTFSSYTVFDGFYVRAVAVGVKDASIPAVNTFVAIQKERQLTMTVLSEKNPRREALRDQQRQVDEDVKTMKAAFDKLASNAPAEVVDKITALDGVLAELPQRRAQVEGGNVARNEIYAYYNSLIDAGSALFGTQARIVPDAEAGQGGLNATDLFRAADWMSRSSSVVSGALAGSELSAQDHLEYVNLVGAYHSLLKSTTPFADPKVQASYQQLTSSDNWRKLTTYESAFIGSRTYRISPAEWSAVVGPVSEQLVKLGVDQAVAASDTGLANGNRKFLTVLIGSIIALLVVLGGIITAVRVSSRLVNRALITRLSNLRQDALTLAHERLPHIVGRLRKGEQVDVRSEVPPLDYGNDEIGQVADAFNAAQYTAVAAAVKESQAREGVNRVFLDIAHRNQGLVHRQLKLLDHLEREEENPEQLDSLFQLDHLATRARRNAENLIILAGEQPGRQWRKPVRLSDVLRSAVAETEQYARVRVHPVPDRALAGVAVADTIHLIAELVDNATAFSSPRSEVQVHSSVVPHGIVVEIEDHGLGMTLDERNRANATLAFPPDFEAMAFKGESRLGLFVVARLAAKRGIKVELRESPYGGTVALIVLPQAIIAESVASAGDVSETTQMPTRSVKEQQHGQSAPADTGGFPVPATEEAALRFDPRPAEHDVNANTPAPPRANEKPALPRRRKQQNLAPQLANEDQPQQADPVPDLITDQSAERTRRGLTAFQQGTRDARAEGAPSA
ncbi:histidine kinase [Lentzea sp. NBRC 105346]|uniref:sensor histidine kinase n=1 Tax=Lentzea sp. NBRC 105346 TaxID=3032205 RepID=UPI0024A314A5|nr:nitrate- and nitrite sensing domain-containing protein [Lentzea sp. NBRC 105346]GLZ33463.1 histidine kinase [Lentzea sp. NBRC 105346]